MKVKILLVDDDRNILSGYERHLRKNYEVVTADNGIQGGIAFKEKGPFAVVVSDYRMPGMDGIKFLSLVRQAAPDTVRVMLTGQADMQAAIDAVNEGNIFRFLTKPCPIDVFNKALAAAARQYQLVKSEKELLEETLQGCINVLVDILSIVSPDSFSQSARIRLIAKRLAVRLDIKNLWEVEIAAMLSQIGYVTIPGDILAKKNQGKAISAEENKLYLTHPQVAMKLLSYIPRLNTIATSIGYQMKQFDGGGVPEDEVAGAKIPIIARILRVAIDFDRLFTKGFTVQRVIKAMSKLSQIYDPDVFGALEADVLSIEAGYIVKSVSVQETAVGMILADDIKGTNGIVLIPKRVEITDVLKMRLLNYGKNVVQPIKILAKK